MVKIKICGLSRPGDIDAVNEALPDYVGFVFAQNSKRSVNSQKAAELKKRLDRRILTVGVFVNSALNNIVELCRSNIIDMIQLHGDENFAYIEELKNKTGSPVIKAVRVQSPQQIIQAAALPCEYLLLDSYQKNQYGGSGTGFDHAMIPKIEKPFFLAGGLNEENIRNAVVCHPYCLDVSSGAETGGLKDPRKIKEIVEIVRSEC